MDRHVSETERTSDHSITLTGLKPSTRYTYRIEPGGLTASFRSAPSKDGAFEIVALGTESPACKPDTHLPDVNPDIVVLDGDCDGPLADMAESVLTLRIPEDGTTEKRFGRWIILPARNLHHIPAPTPEQDFRRIIVLPRLPESIPDANRNDLLLTGSEIAYGDNVYTPGGHQPAWLEVDAFEVAMVEHAARERKRTIVIEAPAETKKTCLYCDRLLESGRYEESLQWYRDFVETNQDLHAIEDAFYKIARISDEKLFDYPNAILAYRDFAQRYPQSRQVPLVQYRLDYLHTHADNGYVPLERFERAKAGLVKHDPLPTAQKIEELLAEYPDTGISSEALLYLGHLLEDTDPKRAARHYNELIGRFPQTENAATASIAIGDILYRQKKYRSAIEAYQRALDIAPPTYRISIEEKLRKSNRNIWRELARICCWAVLIIWALLSFIWRLYPGTRDIFTAFIVLAFYALLAGILFSLTYEKTRELIPIIAATATGISLVVLWNRTLDLKFSGRMIWVQLLHSASCALAVLYLAMYHFHYLYVFGI